MASLATWRCSSRTSGIVGCRAREGDTGRFFLQVHYGRRDIAQRVKPTRVVNHIDRAAAERIASERERRLLGLHPRGFYDG